MRGHWVLVIPRGAGGSESPLFMFCRLFEPSNLTRVLQARIHTASIEQIG